jgi:hypothetical protein
LLYGRICWKKDWFNRNKRNYFIYMMDTDDLSKEAYEAIIVEAERFSHDLTLHFGVLSARCQNELEFIEKSKKLAEEILVLDDYEIEDLLFGNFPPRVQLEITLMKIIRNIEGLNQIPINKRHYDF